QTQIENLVGLLLAKGVTAFHQPRWIANHNAELIDLSFRELECEKFQSRLIAIGRFTNDANELVQVFQRNQVTFERFGALFGLAQFKPGAPQQHFPTVLDIASVRFSERE